MGSGLRVPRRRQRRLAGHPVRQLDELARRSRGRRRPLPALYRNNGDGTFTDITRQAGLAVEMYGIGVAAADYDNDGDVDLYVTALGGEPPVPERRRREVRRRDRAAPASATPGSRRAPRGSTTTTTAGSICSSPTTSSGRSSTDLFCTLDGKTKSYCTPESLQGPEPDALSQPGRRHVRGRDAKAGLYDPTSKALGVALLDYDGDGWTDLFVANDTQPNRLYRNQANGTFADVGMTAGVAFNEAGVARAGMGVDAADYDGSGRARASSSATSRTR